MTRIGSGGSRPKGNTTWTPGDGGPTMNLAMVAVDASGAPVRISGAALAGGPLLVLSPGRRLQDLARVNAGQGGGAFPAAFQRAAALAAPGAANEALATVPEQLPARWGVPTFYGGSPYGPPYELENRTAEWALSTMAREAFGPLDRQARMAQRVHPRGPVLTEGPTFLAALYNVTPTPPYLGVALDAVR